jgi:Tol biopolymer transport system component
MSHRAARRLVAPCAIVLLAAAGNAQTLRLVSANADGLPGNQQSVEGRVSGNGRYVAYSSLASDLIPNDANTGVSGYDIFVRDLQTDTTILISKSSAGVQAQGECSQPSISTDGRFVAFVSRSSNLVANDTNNFEDVFVHDRDADNDGIFDEPGAISTVMASRLLTGEQTDGPNGQCGGPDISADGRYVVFASDATSLLQGAADDPVQTTDAFRWDRLTGVIQLLSTDDMGNAFGQVDAGSLSISADGRFAGFTSTEWPIPFNTFGVIVRDCTLGQNILVSRDYAGNGTCDDESFMIDMHPNGRYIAWQTFASNATANGDTGTLVFDRLDPDGLEASEPLVLTHDGQRPNVNDCNADFSAASDWIAIRTQASNMTPIDFTSGQPDIYRRNRVTGELQQVSVNNDGDVLRSVAFFGPRVGRPSISADGNVIAFHFDASNADANFPPDPQGRAQVFVVTYAPGCPADFNGDNQVDFFDYLDFAAAFDAKDSSADFNHDNQVDFFDYLDFVAAFDAGCD